MLSDTCFVSNITDVAGCVIDFAGIS